MIDLHCHVLPGVDDGSRSIEDSMEMLKKAAASGVEIVVVFFFKQKTAYEIDLIEQKQLIADLQKTAGENGIDIQIKPGYECYLSPDIFEDAGKLSELTINNNGRYILVELPMQSIPSGVETIFTNLEGRGITPIIAHPERNMVVCRNPNVLFDIVSKGCIAQLNAGSILGHFGKASKRIAEILLTHNLVHVVASDMHSARAPSLDRAVPAIRELIGSENASRLFIDNPRKILAGEAIHKEPPKRYEPARRSLADILFRRKKPSHAVKCGSFAQ